MGRGEGESAHCICFRLRAQEEEMFKEKEVLRSQLEANLEEKARIAKVNCSVESSIMLFQLMGGLWVWYRSVLSW